MTELVRIALNRPYTFVVLALLLLIIGPLAALRTPENRRALARVPADDREGLAHLLNLDRSAVGSSGEIVTADDGVLEWRVE